MRVPENPSSSTSPSVRGPTLVLERPLLLLLSSPDFSSDSDADDPSDSEAASEDSSSCACAAAVVASDT